MSAIIFPGQGSQYTKMAMDFNDNYKISSNIFEGHVILDHQNFIHGMVYCPLTFDRDIVRL